METRRHFIKKSALGVAGLTLGGVNVSAKSYKNIMGSNDRIRVGVLGFSDRFRSSPGKAFLKYADDINFELYTLCDIWNRRRDEGQAWYKSQTGKTIKTARNTDEGFQVIYSSRQTNSSGGIKEWYFSNGGKLDLDTNIITSEGGLTERDAQGIGMKPFLLETFELPQIKVESGADTGSDPLTNAHMLNWMKCVRNNNTKTNAPIEAGYSHSIATIMVTAALHTGHRATFDREKKQVVAGGKVFKY